MRRSATVGVNQLGPIRLARPTPLLIVMALSYSGEEFIRNAGACRLAVGIKRAFTAPPFIDHQGNRQTTYVALHVWRASTRGVPSVAPCGTKIAKVLPLLVRCVILTYRVLLLGALCLGACSSGARLDSSSGAVRVATTLPPPDTPVAAVAVTPYRIGPGDELAVTVFGAPELDRTGLVDSAGGFSLPFSGTLVAAGKTPEQFSADIQDALRGAYLKHPRVVVNIKQAVNQQMVTVDGEVTQPGLYPVAGQMTLQQAVATAKGSKDTANIRNVIVFRSANGQKMAAMFDLKAIRSGRAPDPQIYGNDIVIVGESAIQKFLKNTPWLALTTLGRFIPVP